MEMKKMESSLNDERNQRIRAETTLAVSATKVIELQDHVRKVEDSARENKTALNQLISHTKNVERAVTMNQQDLLAKKDQEVNK